MRALLDILKQGRDERERLRLRYNELGLSLATEQEKLKEARTQISILIEDLSLRRQELDSLGASTTSAFDAQSRLQAYADRPRHSSLPPAAPVSTH